MTKPLDPDALQGALDALVEAVAVSAYLTGTPAQVDAIVRVLTDLANRADRSQEQRRALRVIAMRLHDIRVTNPRPS